MARAPTEQELKACTDHELWEMQLSIAAERKRREQEEMRPVYRVTYYESDSAFYKDFIEARDSLIRSLQEMSVETAHGASLHIDQWTLSEYNARPRYVIGG